MDWKISAEERTYLRELAKKQAAYAALPIMEERRKNWYALNDRGAEARPPVIIETWTFDRDFMPPEIFHCQSATAQGIERQLLRTIREHELINDDKVIPDYFSIGWFLEINEFGLQIKREMAADSEGVNLGFKIDYPLKDLRRDLALLQPATCRVDREKTASWQAFMEDLLGDILPIRLECGALGSRSLTNRVVHLMGMEAFFMAMYDTPDEVHQLMAYLRDNALRITQWGEEERLMRLNNANHHTASSFHFTHQLPAPGFDGVHARACDLWTWAESQETVGVKPEMFHEFCFPYYRDACAPYGVVYWGCCEPAHPFWDDISAIPQVKKVSISRWCKEAFVAEAMQGTELVFSRKPDPNFLSVDPQLNEETWAAHIKATLDATRGVAVEFIIRDVYTLYGNIHNTRRAIEVARDVIARERG